MRTINVSTFRTMNREKMEANMPIEIAYEGEAFAVVSNLSDVLVIGDLHPAVQTSLRNRVAVVRAGMPKLDIAEPPVMSTALTVITEE